MQYAMKVDIAAQVCSHTVVAYLCAVIVFYSLIFVENFLLSNAFYIKFFNNVLYLKTIWQ